MTTLQQAMAVLVGVFDNYASSDGDKKTLSRGEFKTLMMKEMPELETAGMDHEKVRQIVDSDDDSEIDFFEFMSLVTILTCTLKQILNEGGAKSTKA